MKNEQNVPQVRFKGFTDAWEQRKLGECFDERTERSADGELIAVTINSGVVKASELNRHDNSSEDKSNYKVVRVNDIAYNSMRMWQGASGYSQYDGILSPAYTVVIPRENVNPVFFSYMFKRTDMIHEFQINSQGLTSDTWNLKFPAFSTISANVPKSEEQQAIGNYFTNLDNLITLHQRKCETLQKLKKSMLQKMFPKNGSLYPEIRFAGFTDAWEQRKLKDVTQRVQGNDGRMDLPTLTISAGYGWLDQRDRFSANIAGKEQKNYTLLRKGELSYNHGNSKLAKYGTVFSLRTYEEALVPRVYHSFKVTDEADADFIEYVFATKLPDKELGKLISSGARMDGLLNINYDEFMGIKITMPSVKEQKQLSDYFRHLDNLITLHQRKLETLKKMKKSMLQKMFI
ncbi:MAG: restriction endonuclease subunit S [Oscillospiraceae bacterium]|nr:restriction endonuclease subunit S [Oscillospiraceae bacterium]